MIFLYLENKPELVSISREEALPAQESQVLEIFSRLSSVETVIFGLIIEDFMEIRILPFSKFVWKVEILNLRNRKEIQVYYSTQKVKRLIRDVFDGRNPMESKDLP